MIINIISLPERKDRLSAAIEQCVHARIEYKVWPGIRVEGKAAEGISKAHKQIVQWAKDNHLSEVIIAEDDFMVTNKRSIEHFIAMKPPIYDIYLGGISGGEVDEKTGHILTQFSGLFFYMLNESFYDCFLEADESMHIDMYVGIPQQKITEKLGRKPIIICCYPMIAITTDGISDNSGVHMNNDIFFRRYRKYRG